MVKQLKIIRKARNGQQICLFHYTHRLEVRIMFSLVLVFVLVFVLVLKIVLKANSFCRHTPKESGTSRDLTVLVGRVQKAPRRQLIFLWSGAIHEGVGCGPGITPGVRLLIGKAIV